MKKWFMWSCAFVTVFFAPLASADAPIGSRDLDRLGYTKQWELQLDIGRGAVKQAYLLDDTLYVVTDEGDVHAIQAGVGLSRWSQNLTSSVYPIYAPSHFFGAGDRPLVVFATGPRTVIIDRYAGDIVADMPLNKAIAGAAVADAENLYFGSNDGHFYAMIWSDPRSSTAVFRWRVIAGGPVTASPVLVNEGKDVVFASQGGSVYNCTTGFKILNWSYATEGPIVCDFVAQPSGTYVASTDRSLYKLETASGALRWRARFHEPLQNAPVVSGETVLQPTAREGLVALNDDNGERLWNVADADGFLCRNLDQFVLSSGKTGLLVVDAESGEQQSSLTMTGSVIGVPNHEDDAVYLVTPRGSVMCAKPVGTPRLTPEDVALARRGLHKAVRSAPAEEPAVEKEEEHRRSDMVDMDDPLRSPSDRAPIGGGS